MPAPVFLALVAVAVAGVLALQVRFMRTAVPDALVAVCLAGLALVVGGAAMFV